jgi:hypothetical protein
MPDVVALELEARAVVVAGLQDVLDVLEAVAEHEVARRFKVRLLPVELELLVFVQEVEERKIHRAHVERGDLRLELRCRKDSLLHAHERAAAGGDVDHRVGGLLDLRQEARERLRPLVRLAGLRIAGVEVQNRRAGLSRPKRLLLDLVRRDRQIGRHARRVDCAGDRARDDDLALYCHV